MTFDDIKLVNSRVNLLPYKAEDTRLSLDDWSPITEDGGDCDSFATEKYRRLVQLGWPKSALRLATCFVETGESHCVLLVDFEGQTWVLDNRYGYPMEYDLLPYKWDRFQIAGTQKWEMA